MEYAERLEHYFVANGIDNADVQRAILFTSVGPSTYRLIKTVPAEEADRLFLPRARNQSEDSLSP